MKWILITLCVLAGCTPKPAAPAETVERVNDQPFGIAQWEFTNRDENDQPVTKGLLTLPSPLPTGTKFLGSWQARYLGKIGEENKIGPQRNGGKLRGEFSSNQIVLELNPDMMDNNVRLIGKVDADSIIGTWEFDTIAGKTNSGTFEAHLNHP